VKIVFDTNVILDVLLLRQPFEQASTLLLVEVERETIQGYLCPTTVTTLYYLVKKSKGAKESRRLIRNLLLLFQITPMDKRVLESSLNNDFADYKDGVLYESALRAGLDGIATRNSKDFKTSTLPVFEPEELLQILTQRKG